ncbi:hypothetical protein [Gilvibacter sediminis]|uniref:hypothetical protein n=1 Tax=Gilvibacter sediminis TaxID=379071 RepID=UPI002350F109|nr:hypothetical protein [Gilvibacter sediminis]MDC7996677.1 hypothetical protein [Gilvibacter sediminis]
MKTLKTLGIVLILSCLITACSKENSQETITIENQSSYANKSALKAPSTAFEGFTNVKEALEPYGPPRLPLTRSKFAELSSIAGITDMDTDSANFIADQMLLAQDMGTEAYIMEKTDFSEFTKVHILKIIAEQSLDGIEEIEGFNRLKEHEQQLLVYLNDVARDFRDDRDAYTSSRFRCEVLILEYPVSTPCTLNGAVLGGAAGFTLCGPPCAVGGAIIGGLVGLWVDLK